MKRFKRKPSTLALTITLAGAAVAYVMLVFLPRQKAIAQLRRDLLDKQLYIAQAEQLKSAIRQTEQELEEARQFVYRWHTHAVSEEELAGLLAQLSATADEAGVRLEKLEPQQPAELKTVALLPVTVQCRGTFSQLFELARQIESYASPLWLSELRLELASEPRRQRGGPRNTANSRLTKQNGQQLTAEITLMVFIDKTGNSD